MRQPDDTPLDPEVAASLDAIDATLAGDPVDPRYAELAEVALLLAAERPRPSGEFGLALDERVQARFAPMPPSRTGRGDRRRLGRWWVWTPAAGLAAAVGVAIVIVLGGGSGTVRSGAVAGSSSTSFNSAVSAPAQKASPAAPPQRSSSAAHGLAQQLTPAASGAPANATSGPGTAAAGSLGLVQPPANGRKIIQGAQLSLTTAARRLESVAQEIFVVVGQVRGIVNNSTVTATGGPGGYAQFQLSIPSGSMPQAMAALSSLRFARVVSRTDTTQDVNNQYQGDVNRLGADRAIRTSLLKQLANASTQGQIDSLTIQLHDINAAISRDQAALRGLTNQINYSQVSVTVNGGLAVPGPVPAQSGSGGGFTLHKAVHDAGRVLTVAVGVALIGLAALAPIAVLAALAWWVAVAVRRRRREQALDLV